MTERGRHELAHEPFWTIDEELCAGELHGEQFTVRMRAHLAEERYHGRRSAGIVPLASSQGLRDYVLIHPYILLPDISIQVGLYDSPTPSGAIGEVVSSAWEGMRQERIGDGQAWFYRAEQTILPWECMLFTRFRADDPAEDANLVPLWQGFERFLRSRFPTATTIATPSFEPDYEEEQWQGFLTGLGYHRHSEQAFAKEVGEQ
jgi:hypothetical protein